MMMEPSGSQQQQQQREEEENNTPDIEYRLVPDPRDLIMARSLLEEEADYAGDGDDEDDGYDDSDDEDDKDDEDEDEEDALKARPFDAIYNEIPIFALATKEKYYMCLSSDNLIQLMGDGDVDSDIEDDEEEEDDEDDNELDSELLSLSEVVERMQQPSTTIDYRKVLLIPPTPIESSNEDDEPNVVSDSFLKQQLADPESFVADTFFTPLFLEWRKNKRKKFQFNI